MDFFALMNFFRLNTGHSRIFGLDLLRFFAVMFVVIGHSMILLPKEYRLPFKAVILDGVSIFFVLSGFLIGGILIKTLEKNKPTFQLLLNFWNRRWLRTLPMYLIILMIILTFTWLMKPSRLPDQPFRYFLFIQNLFEPQPKFFSESWSLSIEEWFYLTVPVLLFGGLALFRSSVKKTLLWTIVLVIIAVFLYRLFALNSFADTIPEAIDRGKKLQMLNHFLTQVTVRLDSIMYGVLAAFVAYYFPENWERANRLSLVIAGLIILYVTKLYLGVYFIVWIPVFKSIAVVMMLPFLSNWKTLNSKIAKAVTFISLISYSMYLVNLNLVIHIIIKYGMNGNLLRWHKPENDWPLEYFLFWVFTIGLSFLFYKFVEVPFMNLRKKER